jgi:2,6-dihydroxypyridine 3-monooxygenase
MAMPHVAVVGGSIGGLTAAVLLRDAGCEVDVYERSPVMLSGYGAGIVVQPEISRYFLERTDIALDSISLPSSAIRYYTAADGKLIGEIQAAWRYTSYNALYRALLRSFGMERYHLGEALVGLDQRPGVVELRFASGRVVHCELAVCADGGFSTARQRLLGIVARYAGYVTWRGVVSRSVVSRKTWDFFNDRFTYGLLEDSHLIAYPIPTLGEDLRVAESSINFQWYWNVPEGPQLDEIMCDRDGLRRPVSVHAEGVQRRYLEELHRRAKEQLALEPFTELITAAEKPFITVIADTDVPRMVLGRACLLGDAAITGRPHAAAGAAKAAANAWALTEALLQAAGDVERALHAWEPAQLQQGRALLAKVRHMGNLLQNGGPFLPGDPACRFGLPPIDRSSRPVYPC